MIYERFLNEQARFILVREAGGGCVARDGFAEWCGRHRRELVQILDHHGGILFRGRMAADTEALSRFTAAAGFVAGDYVGGASPRTRVQGPVYTSTELSPLLPIPAHNEMSYLPRYPRFLLFLCVQPARRAGRTPLTDMHRVYSRLPEDLRARFERHGLTYTFRLPSRPRLGAAKTWVQLMETESPQDALEVARARGFDPVWEEGRGMLTLTSRRPAVLRHPRTDLPVWFNHTQVFHESLPDEVAHSGSHGLAWLLRRLSARRRRSRSDPPLGYSVRFGDGQPISDADVRTLREAIWAESVEFDWRPGDLLLLDNLRAAHGRTPYRGQRRVLSYLANEWPGTEEAPVLREAPLWPGAAAPVVA